MKFLWNKSDDCLFACYDLSSGCIYAHKITYWVHLEHYVICHCHSSWLSFRSMLSCLGSRANRFHRCSERISICPAHVLRLEVSRPNLQAPLVWSLLLHPFEESYLPYHRISLWSGSTLFAWALSQSSSLCRLWMILHVSWSDDWFRCCFAFPWLGFYLKVVSAETSWNLVPSFSEHSCYYCFSSRDQSSSLVTNLCYRKDSLLNWRAA